MARAEKYCFLTCAVRAGVNETTHKTFSVKAFGENMAIVAGINAGNVVEFGRLWKRAGGRRSAGYWKAGPNELDYECQITTRSTVQILAAPLEGTVRNYGLILTSMQNVTIAGRVFDLPVQVGQHYWASVEDDEGRVIEVHMNETQEMFLGDEWMFTGRIELEGNIFSIYIKERSTLFVFIQKA